VGRVRLDVGQLVYRRLLIPIDGSPESASALSPARVLARSLGAEMVLIRVVPTADGRLSVLNSPELDRARAELEAVATTLRSSAVRMEVVVSQGDPAEAIVAEVQSDGADLVVMSTHARSGLARLALGSVAERVVAHSQVPVMLVRPTEAEPGPGHPASDHFERLKLILVPLDGSLGALAALGTASRLARAARAAVVLLRVVVPLPLWIYEPTLGLNTGPLIDPRWDEDRRGNAESYVRRVAQRLIDLGVEAGADAVLGEVAPAITDYADQQAVNLIVMSTHRRFGPSRVLLGSVTDQVVRTARLPVLLSRRSAP
jgi:nucleotide-binding universal stress UspA family protein